MKVLVIDDLESKIQRVMEALPNEEIEVENCWREGIVHIIDKNPDLVVLDMNMPRYKEVNAPIVAGIGTEILRELKRKKMETPVIVYSTDERDYSKYPNVIGIIQKESVYCINADIDKFLKEANLR